MNEQDAAFAFATCHHFCQPTQRVDGLPFVLRLTSEIRHPIRQRLQKQIRFCSGTSEAHGNRGEKPTLRKQHRKIVVKRFDDWIVNAETGCSTLRIHASKILISFCLRPTKRAFGPTRFDSGPTFCLLQVFQHVSCFCAPCFSNCLRLQGCGPVSLGSPPMMKQQHPNSGIA